jgi:hypothetical protein
MSIYGNNLKNNNALNHSNPTFNNSIKPKPNNQGSTVGFMAKLGGGLGVGGYGVKKINDLNDHPNNISDFGHVGKVFGIGESEGVAGATAVASSEAIPASVGSYPMQKDNYEMNFKEKLKNLKIRRK